MKIKNIIPRRLRLLISNFNTKRKYDVVMYSGASANDCYFEGRNILRNNVLLSNSFCGFGTTISENSKLQKVKIGRYCSIGQNVCNGLGMHPSKDFVSTYPGFYQPSIERLSFVNKKLFDKYRYFDDRHLLLIGNDVWIGNNVVIMNGVCIGDGSIVGTGAIVTKDVQPYAIVGGVPAKIIRYRFTEQQIEFLLNLKWWNKDLSWLNKNANKFCNIVDLMEYLNNNNLPA